MLHKSLISKLFNIDVQGNMWTLISSLHYDGKSAVKWQGKISSKLSVDQGVRQSGLLSTDLYKRVGKKSLRK